MAREVDGILGLSSSLKALDGFLTLNGAEKIIIDFIELIVKMFR